MQTTQNSTALVWFKNNLRVQDNQVLNAALINNKHVIAVYVFEKKHFEVSEFGFKKTEKFRAQFLIESIQNLKEQLKTLNIELFVYLDDAEKCIPQLIETHHIGSIYFETAFTSEELNTIQSVKNKVSKSIDFIDSYDQFLFHPDDVFNEMRVIPEVFTNFRKQVETSCLVRPCIVNSASESIPNIINNTQIPTLEDLGFESFKTLHNSAFPFKGGETAALQRLNDYFFKTKKLGVYKKTRNGLLGTDYSSKFSPWLANGSLSAKTIYWNIKDFEKTHYKNDSTYWLIFELIWRDYFKYIALKHGNNIFKIGGILNKQYHWNTEKKLVSQWINGNTSSPFVNANMLELQKTGWMSNRGRQNVASYFSKNMQLDWRIGAAYFESMLIDYDVHSNYCNWLYVSGVGNDPRDRVFNVDLQAERYDTNGSFQKLWLQETLF